MLTSISRLTSVIFNIARLLCVLRACQVIKDPIATPDALNDRDILADLLHHSISIQSLPNIPYDEYAHSLNITASVAMCRAIMSSTPDAHGIIDDYNFGEIANFVTNVEHARKICDEIKLATAQINLSIASVRGLFDCEMCHQIAMLCAPK
jgi:hypothetical protein